VAGIDIGQVVVRQNRVEHLARHGSDRRGREALGQDPVPLRRPRGRLAALGLAHGRLHERVQLVPPRDGEPAVAVPSDTLMTCRPSSATVLRLQDGRSSLLRNGTMPDLKLRR